jgi:hypothetical protein
MAGLNEGKLVSASGMLGPSGKCGTPCARMHCANATYLLTEAVVWLGLLPEPQAATAIATPGASRTDPKNRRLKSR